MTPPFLPLLTSLVLVVSLSAKPLDRAAMSDRGPKPEDRRPTTEDQAPAPSFDLLIINGRMIDGTGAAARPAEIAVKEGRIVAIRPPRSLRAEHAQTTLDATGLIIAPGFIDVHTHADNLAKMPDAEHFLRMGVTTIVAGNCGSSALKIAEAFGAIRDAKPAINFATLIGHNTVRQEVMGSARRAPSAEELQRMKQLVAQAMTDGAVGLSTGLQYVPGTYADASEILELAKVAGAAGGLYASHMRNEGTKLEEAVAETIAIGEGAHCPVQISHLKVDSPNRWGASEKALAMIDAARRRGIPVRADQYLYTAASSGLSIRFPSWALEGGREAIVQRLDDGPTWARIKEEMKALLAERGLTDYSFAIVASYRPDASLNGLSIKQIAQRRKSSDDLDAQLEVVREIQREGGAQMVYHFMADEDIERILRHPEVAIASDSSLLRFSEGVPHPRGYGNNARVLGRYVREKKVLSLEQAVRKMTSLPAAHFKFSDRGVIKEGQAADLVIFDPSAVADQATYERPHAFPSGIPHVIVNGVVTIRDGKDTGGRGGKILRF